jgi:hypothetical protein
MIIRRSSMGALVWRTFSGDKLWVLPGDRLPNNQTTRSRYATLTELNLNLPALDPANLLQITVPG